MVNVTGAKEQQLLELIFFLVLRVKPKFHLYLFKKLPIQNLQTKALKNQLLATQIIQYLKQLRLFNQQHLSKSKAMNQI